MFTHFLICAPSFSALQLTTCIPTTNPRSIRMRGNGEGPSTLFPRGDLYALGGVSPGQLDRRTPNRGCHNDKYSRRSLKTRHRGGYFSSDAQDEDSDEDEKKDEYSDDESYSRRCSHYHSSSNKESGLAGLSGLGLEGESSGGSEATSTLSGSGSPLKMLGGDGAGGGGLPGNPMKMLSGGDDGDDDGGDGGLPGNPMKMLGGIGGGGGGLPGNPMKMLGGMGGGGGGLPGNPMKMLGGGGGGLPIDLPMKGLPGLG